MNDQGFPQQIREVSRREVGGIKQLTINLAIAQTDFEYGISGNMFYVWSSPDGTYINIKVNETSEPAVEYVEQTGLKTPFDKLLITTPTDQAGDLVLLYGTEAPELVQMIDNRGAISGDLATIRDELRGDTTEENWGAELTVGNGAAVEILGANVNRKACIIQAKAVNAGIVYIGFDNTVATNQWIAELLAGMSFSVDDYRGDLYARASAAGQLVGYGEW